MSFIQLESLRGVLLDMDGVLIDSRDIIERAWRRAAERVGRSISDDDLAQRIHGRSGAETLELLFGHLSIEARRELKRDVDDYEQSASCLLLRGVSSLIAALVEAGVPLGLVTSSWHARVDFVLAEHGLDGVFDTIVTREEVSASKPDPAPYLLACQRMANKRNGAVWLAFEDSVSGVRAATRAGCVTIGIQSEGGSGHTEDLVGAGAEQVVADFVAVPVLLGLAYSRKTPSGD